MTDFDEKIKKTIPSEWHMISGSHDSQTSADVFNVNKFELPNPAGKAGGACTSAVLQVLYKNNQVAEDLSWVQLLRAMRDVLNDMGYDQIPQLTSSRLIDVNKTMHIVPPGCTGKKRAILIGINYIGQKGELSGCHNDVANIKEYLENVHGFKPKDMLILMDDGNNHLPTKRNIEEGCKRMVEFSKPGDIVFIHYSGHGGRVVDKSGDEDDGYDETLIPVDFKKSGQILDDWMLSDLVKPMAEGVTCTVLMDCCHSGTVLDLPYRFGADEEKMSRDGGFDLAGWLEDPGTFACCACLGLMAASFFMGGGE